MPSALKNLDDRFLGDRGKNRDHEGDGHDGDVYPEERETTVVEREERRPRGSTGDGLREFLTIFTRVARLVFLLLALIVVAGIVFTLAPANEDNALVRAVLDLASTVAGPFRDVFTVSDDAERELVVNYGFAAVLYFLASVLVTKIPGTKS